MAKTDLTAELVREALHYDPESGVFTWIVQHGPRVPGDRAGFSRPNGYVDVTVFKIKMLAHRLAWLYMTGEHPANDVDHRDGDRGNNRWENLRHVTRSVNLQNQRRPRTGKKDGLPLGVTKKRKRWQAQIHFGGVTRRLGCFDSPEAAHECYLAAKREHHEGNML